MKNVHDIEIEIKGSEWEEILDSTFKKKNKDLKVDGFRKGKCPKSVYLQKFGIESLYMDAVDVACGKAYTNALRENNLIPVCEPKMDVKEIDKDHVKFTFTIITRPEVKLGKYKDLDVKKDEVKVSKKEIDEEVARLCSRFAEIVVKENGEVLEGNTAVIDFEGFVDGKPLEGGNGSNYPLEIGSHTFIPGFEEGLVGMKVDETKELDLKFPDEYTKELAGKDVKFKVIVREIKERVLPELNKDFYADLGYEDIETEEQFRKEVKKVIEERKKEEAKNKYLDDVLSRISGIKSIDKGITYEDITFISDNTLKENEIIIAELNKEEYPKNSYLTLNNYNLIVVGHQKKSNIFYLNSNTLNNIISNTKKTTYIIDLTNWADYNRISDKIIEKTEGFVGIHLNKESKVNYELIMLIFNIFIILNIILFIIILVVTIFNILEDEKKSSLMYRALGFTKLKIIKTNILKLINLFILAIIPSIMLTSILYFLIN